MMDTTGAAPEPLSGVPNPRAGHPTGQSWYSDEALRKQAIPAGQGTMSDLAGLLEPRVSATAAERCVNCGLDARSEVGGKRYGDQRYCALCLSRGRHEVAVDELLADLTVERDLARDAAVTLERELAATMNRLTDLAADIEAVPTAGLTAFGALRFAAGLVSQTVLDMLDTHREEDAL